MDALQFICPRVPFVQRQTWLEAGQFIWPRVPREQVQPALTVVPSLAAAPREPPREAQRRSARHSMVTTACGPRETRPRRHGIQRDPELPVLRPQRPRLDAEADAILARDDPLLHPAGSPPGRLRYAGYNSSAALVAAVQAKTPPSAETVWRKRKLTGKEIRDLRMAKAFKEITEGIKELKKIKQRQKEQRKEQ